MDRDFMGLTKVKDESFDQEPIDAAPVRSLPMQWSFSNTNPNIPHQIMSFQEKPKTGFDSLASTGLISITTSESFDASRKPYVNAMQGFQKNVTVVPEKKHVGNSYSIHHPVTISHTNVSSSVTMHPFGQNLIGSINMNPMTGNSISNPAPIVSHTNNHVVGTTALRNSPKIPSAPAQLTIFYNGSVCVYDNISPEKAQAIMLLASNGPSTPSSSAEVTNPAMNHVQTSSPPNPSAVGAFAFNQSQVTTTISNWPSPSPVNLISITKFPRNNNDIANVKLGGSIFVPSQKPEPLKVVVNPPRSSSVAVFSSDTVPQFRKKSLARFLEKRKERVISSAPYNATKQSAD